MKHLRWNCLTLWRWYRIVAGALGVFFVPVFLAKSLAQSPQKAPASQVDLMTLPLEKLLDVTVTTAARRPQAVASTAAAVFVITQDDIQRSGATSIPEALRLAPGVQVARVDANKWAISARGFNGRFANKLLVLIDGRSVYTPLFSGVYWDVQDVLLEDIERIEVIRGPGAALWGANAVNGIINIITKRAQNTQGGLATFSGGTEERIFGGLRHGTALGEKAAARVYAKYVQRDDSVDTAGNDARDSWQVVRGGLRLDWLLSTHDELTVQGDLYRGEIQQNRSPAAIPVPPFSTTLNDDLTTSGGNVLTRWQHRFTDRADLALQLYYDRTDRNEKTFREVRDTVDLDFQHRFTWGTRHEIIWGLGYRFSRDDLDGGFIITLDPPTRNTDLFSAFIQDDIILVEDRLRLTLGTKLEHNDYTGVEVQPNARLLWTPQAQHTVWAAVSRAVRTPARQDDDIRLRITAIPPGTPGNPSPLAAFITASGSRTTNSEEVLAYELGYRLQPIPRLTLDIAAFYNDYKHLQSFEPGTPFLDTTSGPTPFVVIPLRFDNQLAGETYGLELLTDWRPVDWWRLQAAYSYLRVRLSRTDNSQDTFGKRNAERNPHHQLSFRSSMDLPWHMQFDLWLRYVGELSSAEVPSYVTLDVRLAWLPIQNLELSLVGQNLVESRHPEFVEPTVIPAQVQRGVYGKVTWRF